MHGQGRGSVVRVLGVRRPDLDENKMGGPKGWVTQSLGSINMRGGQLGILGINCSRHFNNLAALALAD